MQKVKLSDALKVSKITTRYGVIDKFSCVDEAVFIRMNDVSGQLTEDALYWTGTSWEITWIMAGTNVVIPRVKSAFVNYQEMVDLISKHKETEMEKAFKLSEVIKVAEVSAGSGGKVTGIRPTDTYWIMEHANGKISSISDDRIEWCMGMWLIESNFKNVALSATIASGGKDVSNPTELDKLLKCETSNLKEILHDGIHFGQSAVINVKPGGYVPTQEEEQQSPIWYENRLGWSQSPGRSVDVPYRVRLSDLVSAPPLRCYINGYPLADVAYRSVSTDMVDVVNANGEGFVLVNTITFTGENLSVDYVDYDNKRVNITITEERTALSDALKHLRVTDVDIALSAFEPSGEYFCLTDAEDSTVTKVVKTEYITHDHSQVLLIARDDEHGVVSVLFVEIDGFIKDRFMVVDLDENAVYFAEPFSPKSSNS